MLKPQKPHTHKSHKARLEKNEKHSPPWENIRDKNYINIKKTKHMFILLVLHKNPSSPYSKESKQSNAARNSEMQSQPMSAVCASMTEAGAISVDTFRFVPSLASLVYLVAKPASVFCCAQWNQWMSIAAVLCPGSADIALLAVIKVTSVAAKAVDARALSKASDATEAASFLMPAITAPTIVPASAERDQQMAFWTQTSLPQWSGETSGAAL